MDRTRPRSTSPSPLRDPAGALVAAPLDPQTYRNLAFVLLSVPLGLTYLAFLAAGFGLVPGALSGVSLTLAGDGALLAGAVLLACLVAGIVALPAMVPVLDVAQRLLAVERRLLAVLLGEAVAEPNDGELTAAGSGLRGLRRRLSDVGLARGLIYLTVKGPLALLALALLAGATALIAALLLAPLLAATSTFAGVYLGVGIETTREIWLCVPIAFPVLGLAIQAVNALAWVNRELAQILLSPAAVARREWATHLTAR